MAVQQSLTNEQLEALHAKNKKLHTAIERVVGKRDYARQANLQLQLQSLNDKAELTTDSHALWARCLQAEAKVAELKERIKELSEHQGDSTATSAALGPLSFLELSGIEGGLTIQASPQLGGGISGLGMLWASTFPPAGRGAAALFAGPTVEPAGSTPFPSPRARSRRSHVFLPSLYLGAPITTAGQAQGTGETMDAEGAGRAPKASTVTTGASSTMTEQDPAQAGFRQSRQ